MITSSHNPHHRLCYNAIRISIFWVSVTSVLMFAAMANAQKSVHFDKVWWDSLDKNEHWDFIYGFTDCGKPVKSGLNMAQYEDFISDHVNSEANSVPTLILLAPRKVKVLPQATGGEVWTGRHGFNDGDLWGNDLGEGRAWVEGYLACEHRPVDLTSVDRYVRLIIRHYANPNRHSDKLASVLEPLLPAKQEGPQP
jgi:hypothetical protein